MVEQHDRVTPFHMHGELVVVLQIHFRRFFDLITMKGACVDQAVGWRHPILLRGSNERGQLLIVRRRVDRKGNKAKTD